MHLQVCSSIYRQTQAGVWHWVQVTPGFDAKGIETVRRDTCPAVAKTMERSLRLLFATRDLSEVSPPPLLGSLHLAVDSPAFAVACRGKQSALRCHSTESQAVQQSCV